MTAPDNVPIKPFSPEDALKALQVVGMVVGAFAARVQKFLNDNPGFLPGLFDAIVDFRNLPQRQKEVWEVAAQQGWYINGHTVLTLNKTVVDGPDQLAAYMKAHLDEAWPDITANALQAFPDRADILSGAFQLHREGRYFASIPVFLAQADGICSEYEDWQGF